MEKKEYVKPNVEVLLLESGCAILAGSDSLGTETDSGDNAARENPSGNFWPSRTSLFDED